MGKAEASRSIYSEAVLGTLKFNKINFVWKMTHLNNENRRRSTDIRGMHIKYKFRLIFVQKLIEKRKKKVLQGFDKEKYAFIYL